MDTLAIPKFTIDKSSWTKVKFGDVVFEPKETVKDPAAEGIEHVVGLEHIDSEDIHLRRSAGIEESTTFTKKFAKGDVLFGRRRAYLKKAAKAEFDGICSGDITVLRAKKNLLPELLPFIVNNEKFFDYAVTHSAGGLSPRVKFKDLAKYEFMLPPKDQQVDLAKLLWSMDEMIAKYYDLNQILETNFKTVVFTNFLSIREKAKNGNFPFIKLKDLITTSICNGVFKTTDSFGSGSLLVNVTDIYSSFKVNPYTLSRVELNEKEKISFSAEPGDVIFNRSSLVKDGIGHTCLVPEHEEKMVFECHLMRVRPNKNKIDPRYLCRYCLSPFGRNYLVSRSQTTTMTTINQDALNRMPIPLPPLKVQNDIADLLDDIDETVVSLRSKVASAMGLQKSLINQVF